jgi:hypothetical protein
VVRLVGILALASLAGFASSPPVFGSGPAVAVTVFFNQAGAPQGTVSALSQALYDAVGQSGKFTPVGGGPLAVQPAPDGAILGRAVDAAARAGAQEVVVAELVSVSGSNVVYRLSAYRVAPLAFIRSQVFTQSSLASPSLTAGFVNNLATLSEPRAATGTIYSTVGGVQADLGAVYGFHLGDRFNVMRDGQHVADAQITSITDDSATVTISNPANGYQPRVGDLLVGLQPLPPLNPAPKTPNTFSILGLVVATGAALLAIGHHGQAAPIAPIVLPSPSPTGGTFTVSSGGHNGTAPNETFIFIFSQPVNIAPITFNNVTYVYYIATSPNVPQSPVTNLGGTQTWDPTDTELTITTTSNLAPGQQITFYFTSNITSQTGTALTPNSLTFTASVQRHPAATRMPVHVRPGIHPPGVPQPHVTSRP